MAIRVWVHQCVDGAARGRQLDGGAIEQGTDHAHQVHPAADHVPPGAVARRLGQGGVADGEADARQAALDRDVVPPLGFEGVEAEGPITVFGLTRRADGGDLEGAGFHVPGLVQAGHQGAPLVLGEGLQPVGHRVGVVLGQRLGGLDLEPEPGPLLPHQDRAVVASVTAQRVLHAPPAPDGDLVERVVAFRLVVGPFPEVRGGVPFHGSHPQVGIVSAAPRRPVPGDGCRVRPEGGVLAHVGRHELVAVGQVVGHPVGAVALADRKARRVGGPGRRGRAGRGLRR